MQPKIPLFTSDSQHPPRFRHAVYLGGDRYFNTDWQFEMFKRGKPMDMVLVECIFQKRYP